jgi:hypothetical protein
MKEIHYRNIGYPKTGTNWLWKQFMTHPQVDARFHVMYKEYRNKSVTDYKKTYNGYRVSINLDPHVFVVPGAEDHTNHPKVISEYTTHLTFIFRNIYEVLNSMYNMEKNRNNNFTISKEDYANINNPSIHLYCNTKKIFDDWANCKLPIKIMFYDDLKQDQQQFMFDICNYIGIKPFYNKNIDVAFKTDINEPLIFEDQQLISYINDGISVIEDYTKRDLSHWKK